MIISQTPFRVSLFGGGTDYPAWYHEHGGSVLGTCINKYCYISLRTLSPFFEHRHRVVYSSIELVKEIDEIQHPSVRAVLQETGVEAGLEIHHDGDLPARSGLGSSSSFTVGLLNAIHAYRGRMVCAKALADEAIRLEQDVIGENVGSQDQIWASHGGTNLITFSRNGDYEVKPVVLTQTRKRQLESSMMLFFSGLSRHASAIAAHTIANLGKRKAQLTEMSQMVGEAMDILGDEKRCVGELGALLDDS